MWGMTRCSRRVGLAGMAAIIGARAGKVRAGGIWSAVAANRQGDGPGEDDQHGESETARRRRRRRPAPALCQRIVVPAYFGPGAFWERAVAGAPSTGLIILNVNSGPGDRYQEAEGAATRAAQAAGITVLGYVRTNLARRPAAEVEAEIDKYFDWYGVDGIYIDVATGKQEQIPYYRSLAEHVRGRSRGATVALSPALDLNRGYLDFVDIYCLYEWRYEDYRTKRLPEWIHEYPAERFIHVVYGVPKGREARRTLRLAKQRNAGYVFLTNIKDPERIYKSLGKLWAMQVDRVCP